METPPKKVMDTPLKALRVKKGLTTTAVAAAVGIDQGTYWRIENGARTTADTAAKITQFFADAELTEMHVLYPERFVRPNGKRRPRANA